MGLFKYLGQLIWLYTATALSDWALPEIFLFPTLKEALQGESKNDRNTITDHSSFNLKMAGIKDRLMIKAVFQTKSEQTEIVD